MSEWIHSTVGAVTAYQRAGGTPSVTVDEYYGGEIPFVTIEDITKSTRFLNKTEKRLSEKGLLNSAAWLIKEPHILYSMYATVGKPIINHIPCATNQAIIALKESPKIEQSFLYYQLLFIRPQVYKYTSQTTQSNLNAGSVKKLSISYPKDRQQQQKIVAVLSSIDVAIEKTEALIAKYQQIKAGLMHDLFTRGITADGKLRPSREQAPELYQETPLGWIPKEWKIEKFKDITEILTCGVAATPDYVESSIGVPFLSAQNVNEGKVNLRRFSYIPMMLHKQLTKYSKPKKGDILYSRVGAGYGEAAVVEFEWEFSVYVSLTLIRMKKNYDNYFYKYLLNSYQVKNRASIDVYQGGGVPNLNVKVVREFLLPVPEHKEQIWLADKLKLLDKKIDEDCKALEKLKDLRAGLMSDLLTGKVRVKGN
ncbi:MAG: restriction endonuclease subunit S [Nitrosomonadaceae bacterium]|nr:restriction endonuclease subunit S [Nitrosomonadaceae bacterium]